MIPSIPSSPRAARRATCRQPTWALRSSALLAGVGALSGACTAADYASTVLATPNLVGYWRFEPDTQFDSLVPQPTPYLGTPLGNAAVGASGSAPAFAGAADNRALVLDGNGDGVTTTLSTQAGFATAATVVAWVYLNRQPSTAGHYFEIASRSQNGNDLDFQIDSDDLLHFYTDYGGAAVAPEKLPLHQWMLVAGSFDTVAGTRKVYIDGRPVASNVPGPHSADGAALTIGYSGLWPGRWFDGALDEVAIFDRALSDAEIRALQDAAGDLIFRSNFTY